MITSLHSTLLLKERILLPRKVYIKEKFNTSMNGWKTFAIILLIILILESSFLGYALYLGQKAVRQESQCSVNICGQGYQNGTYDSYHFEDDVCTCFKDGRVISTTYVP